MSSFLRDERRSRDIDGVHRAAGSFYLREIKRPLLFLAGGTGLAPFLSMLGTDRRDRQRSNRST